MIRNIPLFGPYQMKVTSPILQKKPDLLLNPDILFCLLFAKIRLITVDRIAFPFLDFSFNDCFRFIKV